MTVNSRPRHQEIGNEGWGLLAKAVALRPGFVERISCCHSVLQEATKEDMRLIWEVVGNHELVHEMVNENFKIWDGKEAWRRLAVVIDMTEDELIRDICIYADCRVTVVSQQTFSMIEQIKHIFE